MRFGAMTDFFNTEDTEKNEGGAGIPARNNRHHGQPAIIGITGRNARATFFYLFYFILFYFFALTSATGRFIMFSYF